ncbi:hypothetical protein JCM19231_3344 [Vibrio ishigakensis]|uniref:Uncharacterized protein n=1 Tax=Vibrio ishigakensis TaxID=1481914 RepID=A0A0B8P510_9VIBR|nr:hypothetical protein JCM19231_3344 [Vibrio ishigakensis]
MHKGMASIHSPQRRLRVAPNATAPVAKGKLQQLGLGLQKWQID